MKHYPQYTVASALETESLVLALLYAEIPDIHLKRAWPFIQLQAFIGNSLGGKGKGDGEAPDPGSLWKAEEFAPSHLPRALGSLPAPPLEPQHCYAFERARVAGHLEDASWVFQFLAREDSLERIEVVAVEYAKLLESDK